MKVKNNKNIKDKMKTLNRIFNEKVRSMMTSLQLSKKECQQLKDLNKENKRSKLIQDLQKDVDDQDFVI